MISDCAFVRLNTGLRLAYTGYGAREGAPLVLLHGYTDSHRSFDLIAPFLPQSWRVLAVTQRGHGLSDKPAAGYTMPDLAADVPGMLDAFGIDRAVLVGHSMGAAVALHAAAAYPERVAGLALLGAFADFAGNPAVEELAAEVRAFEVIDPEFVLAFQESTVAGMIPQRFLDTVVAESLRCPAPVWRAALEGQMACSPLRAAAAASAPAVLIRGEHDVFVPHADQLALRQTLSSSRLFTVAGAGHSPHWERPQETALYLRAFLGELRSADMPA